MFPVFRDGGPFIGLLPFPTGTGPSGPVAPVLSSPLMDDLTTEGGVPTVTTNQDNGTLYYAILTNGGSATDAQIKAGAGGDIVAGKADSQAVSATGVQTFAEVTGLLQDTAYEVVFLQTNDDTLDSAQAEAGFTTDEIAPAAGTITFSGTDIIVPATAAINLTTYPNARYGVDYGYYEFGAADPGYVFSRDVAAAALNQSITLDEGTDGYTATSLVNVRSWVDLENNGTKVYSSAYTTVVGANPSISGTAEVGETLTATNPLTVGAYPISHAYSWLLCDGSGDNCSAIPSETAATYLIDAGDEGDTIRVLWTASGVGYPSGATAVVTGGISPEAAAVIAAMSPTPDATRQGVIDDLVVALLDGAISGSDIWAKLDRLWVLAADSDGSAGGTNGRINWIAPGTDDLSETGTPVWTEDRGYTGVGVTANYLSSATNLSALTNFTQDSAVAAIFVVADAVAADTNSMAASNGTGAFSLWPRQSSGYFRSRINQGSNFDATNGSNDLGLFTATRRNSTDLESYRNATSLGTASIASIVRPNFPAVVCGNGATGSDQQIGLALLGSQLSDDEVTDLYNAVNAYMVAVGAV